MAALAVAALPGALAVSTAWPARVFLALVFASSTSALGTSANLLLVSSHNQPISNSKGLSLEASRMRFNILANSSTASLTVIPSEAESLELLALALLLMIFSNSVLAAWAPLPAAHPK
eukprot:CAMPEP_0119041660 /NCGR_PEP_ID=MMETSP1177-20130426/12833_1 /TAXON_ID=2985 /ORGANISM="Ochromonas sp, Strain CCMP1899" /LENGTH=117 /DNA_ID=CAMNT_0007007873 /DNA_START=254 /DNA_END=607 /DNA_ORIENTATION=+